MQTTDIKNVANEHTLWLSTLSLHKDEIREYRIELTEIASKNSAIEIMKQVEHFQNSFLIKTESIDILRHDIKGHIKKVSKDLSEKSNHIIREENNIHKVLKERFDIESKLFTEMKGGFEKFVNKIK